MNGNHETDENMERIRVLKQSLITIAKQHRWNFIHPEVVKISQELDKAIIQAMSVHCK